MKTSKPVIPKSINLEQTSIRIRLRYKFPVY